MKVFSKSNMITGMMIAGALGIAGILKLYSEDLDRKLLPKSFSSPIESPKNKDTLSVLNFENLNNYLNPSFYNALEGPRLKPYGWRK